MLEMAAEQNDLKTLQTIMKAEEQPEINVRRLGSDESSQPSNSKGQLPAESQGTNFVDAIGNYFDTELAGRDSNINLRSSEQPTHSRSHYQRRPTFAVPRHGREEIGNRGGRARSNSQRVDLLPSKGLLPLSEFEIKSKLDRLNDKLTALEQKIEDKSCRVCFSGEEQLPNATRDPDADGPVDFLENPLLSPCNCTGSTQYVHLKCLQNWLSRSRLEFAYEECTTTIYKTSSCELCKAKYPDQISIHGQKYEIFEIKRPKDVPYLILEVLGMPEGKNIKVIGVHPGQVIVMGRGEGCELIINDQSISLRHAKIMYSTFTKQFLIQDYGSKFGTLKVIQKPVHIPRDQEITVQVGCTVLKFAHASFKSRRQSCFARCLLPRTANASRLSAYLNNCINPRVATVDETNGPDRDFEFFKFPQAIPEEVFLYFGQQQEREGQELTQQERLVHQHFYKLHHTVLEHREDKEIFRVDGFTLRN